MDATYLLVLMLSGLAAFVLCMGLYDAWQIYWKRHHRAGDVRLHAVRLTSEQPTALQIVQDLRLSQYAWVDEWLRKLPGMLRFDQFLRQTHVRWDVSQVIALMLSLILCLAVLTWLGGGDARWLFVWGIGTPSLVMSYLLRSRQKYVEQIEEQLPDALDLMVRALQSGHAFTSALQMTALESKNPIRDELRTVFDEINLGTSVQVAMSHLAQRVASKEMRYFVVAVLIQRETGGNLGDVLRSTATLIRERQKIAGVVRVLSAEGRISAWILALMPFVLAVLMYLVNPEFMALLWREDMGVVMLGVSLGLMVAGVFWMSRLVRIKV
jgi:tight adherence protein B